MRRGITASITVGLLAGFGLIAQGATRGRGPTADVRAVGSFQTVPCTEQPATQSIALLTTDGDVAVLSANGIPDHSVGAFPNRGNPHTIAVQSHRFEIPLHPSGVGGELRRSRVGVALNGIPLDPGTAEYFNDDRGSGWRYEALSGAIDLGVDCNHAHVQPGGLYHYHGIPEGLLSGEVRMELVGYAADGYPLYARYGVDESGAVRVMRSSYRLREGERDSGPGGVYDGTFVQDYAFVEGLGDLDARNGRVGPTPDHGETYYYLLTDEFPFVPRCTIAEQDPSFALRGPPPGGGPGGPPRR